MVDVGLCALCDAHLEVNAVAHDVDLCRLQRVEEVTVVPVVVAHGIIVLGETFVHELLVVDVALLHAEHLVQVVGRIDGVAHPCYVAYIIFLALVHLQANADVLVVDVPHAVADDGSVAVAILVILFDELLLVGLPALGCKLLRLEERSERSYLMGLCEGALLEQSALYLAVFQRFVAFDVDLADLHLLLFVDDYIKDNLVLVCHVVALTNLDVGVLEALVVEIFLGKNLRAVNHVRCDLSALQEAQFLLHVGAFRFFQAHIIDCRHTRSHAQMNVEKHLVADDRVGHDAHVREQAILPVVFHRVGDLVAGECYVFAHCQSGDACEHVVLITLCTRHVYCANGQRAWRAGIRDVGIDNLVLCLHRR